VPVKFPGRLRFRPPGRRGDDELGDAPYPPDIHISNYQMIDLLLRRTDDMPLWTGTAQPLSEPDANECWVD
jgi:hypothetical protein